MVGLFFMGVSGLIILWGLKKEVVYFFVGLSSLMIFILVSFYSSGYYMVGGGAYVDSVGVGLVILSLWVGLLMLFSSYKILRLIEGSDYFLFMVYFLMLILVLTFLAGDYLGFYFLFEVSLIPTLIIIMGWGYQPERLQAGVYFIFYTLAASLPLLLSLNYFLLVGGSLSFVYWGVSCVSLGHSSQLGFILLISMLAFLVKLPMYFTHLWLPKAHVEAPVAGSMILAGVLLKLGGYGLMRMFLVTGGLVSGLSSYFTGLSLMGMVYIGFICCRLNDFKALVAYSSVAHMGMVICGVMNVYYWGFNGCFMMMVAHGVASSGLFCVVNMYYERLGSRSFYINKGLMLVFPIFSLLMFLLAAANIAAPPTINLMSEIFLMASILSFDKIMLLVLPAGSFLGVVFTVYMFSYSQHGRGYLLTYGFVTSNYREFHTLVLHIFPLNLLILNSGVFITV
uniref:NADH-ubiquinone oxidoreductase chain 4 n=1 Tax=Proisotoma minuta TaxID=301521 RepID=A0A8K1HI54_9HEXA|nr:NADH dehydrogenase subunit 4 [Proisotoma minuta]